MRVEFPLWLVTKPGPTSALEDICTELRDFEYMVRVLAGSRDGVMVRDPALYTNEPEATSAAHARLRARDAALAAKWIPLAELRPGATFELREGHRAVKVYTGAAVFCRTVGLSDGVMTDMGGSTLVREIPIWCHRGRGT